LEAAEGFTTGDCAQSMDLSAAAAIFVEKGRHHLKVEGFITGNSELVHIDARLVYCAIKLKDSTLLNIPGLPWKEMKAVSENSQAGTGSGGFNLGVNVQTAAYPQK